MTKSALFVGLGGVGQRHLRNLRALWGADASISAYRVRRESTELTDTLTTIENGDVERSHAVRVFTDLSAALETKPRITIVANPSSLHVPIVRAALAAGSDVFVEKPLSADFEGVTRIVEDARRLDRVGFVAYQLRFHPAVQTMLDFVASGELGAIHGGHVEVSEYLPGFHPYEDYRRMYASRRDLGGGVTLTQIHEIDLLYALFGLPERVYSIGAHVSALEIDVEDTASSLLGYRRADGCAFAIQLHQDYLGRPPRRSFCLWGERGHLALHLRRGSLAFTNTDGVVTQLIDAPDYPRNQMFHDELQHFLGCVETRSAPIVSLHDGAQSLRVALALRASQETERALVLRGEEYVEA